VSLTIYQKAYLDSLEKVKDIIIKDLQAEDFNWEKFLSSMVEEGSPLEEIFSAKTLQLADLHLLAIKIKGASEDLEEDPVEKEENKA
jgi:hypothetical protein